MGWLSTAALTGGKRLIGNVGLVGHLNIGGGGLGGIPELNLHSTSLLYRRAPREAFVGRRRHGGSSSAPRTAGEVRRRRQWWARAVSGSGLGAHISPQLEVVVGSMTCPLVPPRALTCAAPLRPTGLPPDLQQAKRYWACEVSDVDRPGEST